MGIIKPEVQLKQPQKEIKDKREIASSDPLEKSTLPWRKRWLNSVYFDWGLGLGSALVLLGWLALPSRLPALGLGGLIVAGGLARFYALHPALVQGWLKTNLTLDNLKLALVMLLALGLRFVGLSQSLPYIDNPDEPTMVNGAIKMLQSGDFNPHYFRWPSLPIYAQFVISIPTFFAGVSNSSVSSIKDLANIPTESFFLSGRIMSAILGSATVFLTFRLGKLLYSPAVGLMAALIVAVLPLQAEHSHYVTPDMIVTFFAALTLLFAAYIYKTGAQSWYWWVGVAAGLTLGSKYNVGVVLFTVLLAHFLAPKERRGRLKWLAGSFGLAAGVFLLTTPFAILDLPGFLNEIAFQVRHYTILGHGSASEEASWSAYLGNFYQEAFVYQAIVIMAGGILLALLRQWREDWLVLSFPAVGFLFFASARVHFSRNLLPLLPPLAILSAGFLLALAGWLLRFVPALKLGKPKVALGGLSLGLFAVFFAFAIQHSILTDRYYLQPDTRRTAGDWIVQNIPAGAKLRLEPQTPILPAGRYPGSDERRPIGAHPLEWYKQQGYDYLIASSYYYRDLSATDPEAAANYQALFQKGRLLIEFVGENNSYPGPTLKIFKVEK